VAGYIALTGDLPGALASFKAGYPLLLYPAKFAISFPLIFHFLGGEPGWPQVATMPAAGAPPGGRAGAGQPGLCWQRCQAATRDRHAA
jgi:hypothetical protein